MTAFFRKLLRFEINNSADVDHMKKLMGIKINN